MTVQDALRHNQVTHGVQFGANIYVVQLFHKSLTNTALKLVNGALRPTSIFPLCSFLVFVALHQTIISCYL